jgi:hypothetical protein
MTTKSLYRAEITTDSNRVKQAEYTTLTSKMYIAVDKNPNQTEEIHSAVAALLAVCAEEGKVNPRISSIAMCGQVAV